MTERTDANAGDRVWNGDARQTAATLERTSANRREGVWDGDARQTAATIENETV